MENFKINTDIKCICCEKEIKSLDEDFKNEVPWEGMYNSAVVDKVSAGYGSSYDMDIFRIAICDKCVEEKLEKNIIQDITEFFIE